MPRIRTIKPELWSDEKLGYLPLQCRLLFIGLFSTADDQGRFRAHVAAVRAAVFPYDDKIPAAEIESWLDQLSAEGLITLYRVKKQTYGSVANWDRHQKVNHPAKSRLPEASEESITEYCEYRHTPLEGLLKSQETLLRHTSDLRPPTSTTDQRPASEPRPPDPTIPPLAQVTAKVDPPTVDPEPDTLEPPPRVPERDYTPRGRPVVPASEVVREWNERMHMVHGYPEASPVPGTTRAIDAITARDPYRTLGWWTDRVFPAVHAGWCGIPAQPRQVASLHALVTAKWGGEAGIVDLVAQYEAAQRRPPPQAPGPKPGTAAYLAQIAFDSLVEDPPEEAPATQGVWRARDPPDAAFLARQRQVITPPGQVPLFADFPNFDDAGLHDGGSA